MYKVIFWLLRVTREAPWLLHWWLAVDPFMLFIDTDITRQSHEADSCTRPFKHTVRTYPHNPVASSISDINIQHKRLLYRFINTDVSFWQHHALIMSSRNFILLDIWEAMLACCPLNTIWHSVAILETNDLNVRPMRLIGFTSSLSMSSSSLRPISQNPTVHFS